jgi:hypothetical protein
MWAPAMAALAACAVALSACGSSTKDAASTTTTYPPLNAPLPAPPHKPHRPAGPRVGQTQRVNAGGTTLSVTISRVTDPLRDSGASLLPGTRAIGVQAVIADDGPAGYDSSSTGDFSVVSAAGAARPVFAASGVCATPLRDWDNEISPGETRSGCIAYSLPKTARVIAIRFSPHAKANGRVTWAVR